MNYKQAIQILNDNSLELKVNHYLFVAPQKLDDNLHKLRATKSIQENEAVLKELGLINSDDLDVYITYLDGTTIRYPKLSDYFLMLSASRHSER